jgi:hypothetical protein
VTTLPPANKPKEIIAWTIRQLDLADDGDDLSREPYRSRVAWLQSEFHRTQSNVLAIALLAGGRVLNNLAWLKPAKRKKANPLDRAADFAAADVRQIRALWKAHGLNPLPERAFNGDLVGTTLTAEEVAVERHLRITGMRISQEERDILVQKVSRRVDKPSGPSRASRAK